MLLSLLLTYLVLVGYFQYYNKKYYNDNISEISDSEYDLLKKEIIDLEKKKINF